MAMMKPERLDRIVVYESSWVNLYLDRVRFPNGRIIEKHHLLHFPRLSVFILIQDPAGRLLLIQVSRYATGTSGWELPAGGVEPGETILEAAEREVLEETGFRCTDYEVLYGYYPMSGIADALFYILRCVAGEQIQAFDPAEVSQIRWFSLPEIETMIARGEITDGPTLTAFLLHQRRAGWPDASHDHLPVG
jgi:ADP-ribose pyrophosphatase